MSCHGSTPTLSRCQLNGLPIGVPFKSKFSDMSDTDLGQEASIFVLLPLQPSDDIEAVTVNVGSDGVALDIQLNRVQQDLVDKLVFGNWNFFPADDTCWKAKHCSCKCLCNDNSLTANLDSELKLDSELIERSPDLEDAIFKIKPTFNQFDSNKNDVVNDKISRKRKHKETYDADWDIPTEKLRKCNVRNTADNCRKSQRLKAAGIRPSFKAIEEGSNRYYTSENNDNTIIKLEDVSYVEDSVDCNHIAETSVEGTTTESNLKENDDANIHDEQPLLDNPISACDIAMEKSVEDSVLNVKSEALDTELDEPRKDRNKRTKRKNKTNKTKVKASRKTTKNSRGRKTSNGLSDERKERQAAKAKALELKRKEEEEKKLNRVKIKLENHPDKYKVDVMGSFARKDRGKTKEECETEVLLCTVCEKFRSKSKDILETHIECHVNGELNCEQCDFVAAFIGDLQKHKRMEHKKNVCVCSECGAETSGQIGLKDHMGKVHANPQYTCKHCLAEKGEKFACITKTKFRQHLRAEHPDKMVACEMCKGLFAHKYHLQKHLNTRCPGDGTKQYPCEICGKTYSTFQHVNNHITRVHNKVRKFQCKLCPFAAAGAPGLAQHMHTHTGYHPFKCDQCTFSCVQRFQLTSHMRTHTGEKPYKCSLCNYAAAWNVQLKDHLRIHSLPTAVLCDPCEIMFKDARGLKSHQTREHSRDMINLLQAKPQSISLGTLV